MTSFYYEACYMYLYDQKSFKVLLDCSINKGEKCDVALQW